MRLFDSASEPPSDRTLEAQQAAPLERALRAVRLASSTSPTWCDAALADLHTLLEDHCQCELKAASSALGLIGRNPEKEELAHRLMQLVREEMQHYRQVRELLSERGMEHRRPQRSPYLSGLNEANRGGPMALLDALTVSAVVEARSCERFIALARRLREANSGELGDFYENLARSEAGHAHVFVALARCYYDEDVVQTELARRISHEAEVLARIPVTARMHGGNGAP